MAIRQGCRRHGPISKVESSNRLSFQPRLQLRPRRRSAVVGSEFRVWSGARDLNPGPHGPESDGVPSNRADFCGFHLEISDPACLLVQKWVNLRPNYHMKYYTPMSANRRLPWPTVDRPTNTRSHA